MTIFASWGVDYIKLDSCFAESNGRLSTDDYALYRECIENTGRPILLSISDFGNGAWAWDGQRMAQLWRTSYDIYPWMGSVYNCAETSAGDHVIHPAFNGLWQFAGPGHWNDPDMLQVGNLRSKKDIEDKAHFSLWCILAAPLMAGNDLTTMSESVIKTLTAPEPIAVNQDPRGIQGYKIYDNGDHEIYNKPLADGTTAVLILNKGGEPADITVTFDKLGLKGPQPVRDLWTRKNLGRFKDSYTATALPQHGHKLLKIGKKGKPLPAPKPLAPEKYTITKSGVTYLSDLAWIWRRNTPPVQNKTFDNKPIVVAGKTYDKGLGCKGKTRVMYKLNFKAKRFKATIAIDPAYTGEESGRFRVYNEDFFGNRVIYDSGKMTKDSAPKQIDIDITAVDCLMLTFDGDKIPANWANPCVIATDIASAAN
jgi:alpha-galactosidase